jgi:hypothetical protein
MSLFTEKPVALAVLGAICAIFPLLVFLSRRTLGSLFALAGVLVLTLGLILVERLIVTDREAILTQQQGVLAAVEANDLRKTLTYIDPAAAAVRSDAQTLMPQVKVNRARRLGDVEVKLDPTSNKADATTTFRGFLEGVHTGSGLHFGYMDQVDIHWAKQNEKWLITGYTAYHNNHPINAVSSIKSKRPVPGK